MIFMSQSGLTDGSREEEWGRWYIDHLKIMTTVPGISSAQRFRTSSAGHPPSLAIYSVASAAVFQDPYYLSVRGMGEWLPLVDKRYYRRNLFEGSEHAPQVSEGRVLVLADRNEPAPTLAGLEWTWLKCAGIDRSTAYRGLAVLPEAQARSLEGPENIAVYAPATARYSHSQRG